MTPGQLTALEGQRNTLAMRLQALLDTPEAERPIKPAHLRAWLREVESARIALRQLDSLLKHGEHSSKAKAPAAGEDDVIIARIAKGRRTEVRVSIKHWNGRRSVEVRSWELSASGQAHVPTNKGIVLDASMLDAVIDALRLAQQHA